MFKNPFKKRNCLPEIAPELKEKIVCNYLETLIAAGDEKGTYAGAEIMATQIFLKIMDDTTEEVNKYGKVKDNFKPEERTARNALYFHKMLTTKEGETVFKNIYDFLMELLKKYEAAAHPQGHT